MLLTLCVIILSVINDFQHNDTRYCYAECSLCCVIYAECHKLAHYAENHYAEYRKLAHYAECHYTECHHAECRFMLNVVAPFYNI